MTTLTSITTLFLLFSLSIYQVDAIPIALRNNQWTSSPLAPLASDMDGVSIILENNVDSSTPKYSFLLMSHLWSYNDAMVACHSMGESGYIFKSGTEDANSLLSLLKNNSVAQEEVSMHTRFWVVNNWPNPSTCLALNKDTGETDRVSCSAQLPSICFNSVRRRVLIFNDHSRQIRVDTPVGQIQGWRDQNSFRFLGIPYAEAPVGKLRFAAPVPKAEFQETHNAIQYGHICPQTPASKGLAKQWLAWLVSSATEDEDCLNLNVYTPSLKGQGTKPLPVMLYLHGGGYSNFSGSAIIFEPGNLVSRGGVVVVTINYRLGLLGWLEDVDSWSRSIVPGNQAFRDQILALQWVQKNIASFGGDPDRVTVFGQSAGAHSIRALLSAPSTFGLYHRVISESDPLDIPFKTPYDAAKISNYLLTFLGCNSGNLDCARAASTNDILEATVKADQLALDDNTWTTFGLVERVVIDGELIENDFAVLVKEGRYNTNASIMWSTVKDEAGTYVSLYFPDPVPIPQAAWGLELIFEKNRTAAILNSSFFPLPENKPDAFRVAFTQFGTDYYWLCPLQYLSRQMTKHKPIYAMRFNRGRDIPLIQDGFCSASTGRVCHSNEIQSVFASGAAVPGFSQTGDDARYARQVIDRLTLFAKTGNPNPQNGSLYGVEAANPDVTSVEWRAYDDSNAMLEFDVESRMVYNLQAASCEWIENELKPDFMLRRHSSG